MEFRKYSVGESPGDAAVMARALWFSGWLEAGGGVLLKPRLDQRNGKKSSDLIIGVQDKDPDKLVPPYTLFGGSYRPTAKSNEWTIRGERAGWLLERLGVLIPSYSEIVPYIRQWNQIDDPVVEYAIALASRSKSRALELSLTQYLALVCDPMFMSGVVDRRGGIGYHNRSRGTSRVTITTNNKGLLDAVQLVHGGNRQVWKQKGETFELDGVIRTVSNESATLAITNGFATNLIALISATSLVHQEKIREHL